MANSKLQALFEQITVLNSTVESALVTLDAFEQKSILVTESAGKVGEVSENVRMTADTIDTELSKVEAKVDSVSRSSETKLGELRDMANNTRGDVSGILDELLDNSFSKLDEVIERLRDSTGIFDKELAEQLELVRLGILSLSDLSTAFKNADFDGQRLIEVLEGVDFSKFQQDLQKLVASTQSGASTIEDVMSFLIARGGELGQSIADWVRKAQEGTISVETFRREIALLLKKLEDFGADTSALEQLLEDTEDLFQNDSRTQ